MITIEYRLEAALLRERKMIALNAELQQDRKRLSDEIDEIKAALRTITKERFK